LEWIGNPVRVNHGRVVKKIFEITAKGRRRMERPRLRWLVDVEKDLWEMKVKKW
jgi:DNA-binding PadR family transcriptional regulator